MGTSVCAYHIRGCTREDCLGALGKVRSPRAFVSIPTDSWLTVIDEDCDAFSLTALEKRVAEISTLLRADVIITWIYDDDAISYVAFHEGSEIDRYCSGLSGFSDKESRKVKPNPKRLSEKFSWWTGQAALEKALKKILSLHLSRLTHIVRSFGIPEYRAFTKIKDILHPRSAEQLASIPQNIPYGMGLHDLSKYVEYKA